MAELPSAQPTQSAAPQLVHAAALQRSSGRRAAPGHAQLPAAAREMQAPRAAPSSALGALSSAAEEAARLGALAAAPPRPARLSLSPEAPAEQRQLVAWTGAAPRLLAAAHWALSAGCRHSTMLRGGLCRVNAGLAGWR